MATLGHSATFSDESGREMKHRNLWLGIAAIVLALGGCFALPMEQQRQHDQHSVWRAYSGAEAGEAQAQYELGRKYDSGDGVVHDKQQAAHWYRLSAEQGHIRAQDALGMLYKDGTGVAQDDERAVYWFRKAAVQGDPYAQVNLGMMYEFGMGVAQDNKQAVHWYREAAEQGFSAAQFSLGFMYRGIRAYYWVRLAMAQGFDLGGMGDMFADVKKKVLTPQEIALLDALVAQCKAARYKNCGRFEPK